MTVSAEAGESSKPRFTEVLVVAAITGNLIACAIFIVLGIANPISFVVALGCLSTAAILAAIMRIVDVITTAKV